MRAFLFFLTALFVCGEILSSPLKPVLLGTPRETLKTYINSINRYKIAKENQTEDEEMRLENAVRCFDLSHIPYLSRSYEGKKAALLLKEVLDRIIFIDFTKVPDDNSVTSWRLKGTEVYIEKVSSEGKRPIYKFSKDTVNRIPSYYYQVKHLNYLKGLEGVGYEEFFLHKVFSGKKTASLGPKGWQWTVIVLAFFFSLLVKLLFKVIRIFISSSKTERLWRFLENPLTLLGITAIWFFAFHLLGLKGNVLKFFNLIAQASLSISFFWFLYNLTEPLVGLLGRASQKIPRLDSYLLPLIRKTARVLVVTFGTLMTIQVLGFNVISIMAGLGIGGLALALAAKDTAANLFGSMMILIDQPFRIGDVISTSDVEGVVDGIGFRSTRIRTFYNSVVSVPNSIMANQNIDNLTSRRVRRVRTVLGVTYGTAPKKMEAFLEGVKNILKANPKVDPENYHVYFQNYGPSSLDVLLYFFIQTDNYGEELSVRQNVFMEILRLAEKLNVDFAFPTQTVHVHSEEKQNAEKFSENELKEYAQSFGPQGKNSKPEGLGIFNPPYKK